VIGQQRLDALVASYAEQGWDAGKIARLTGVPVKRVRLTLHRQWAAQRAVKGDA
jgi:DNA-directed RNA polymerase specialized sigma24 family protein